MTSAEAGGEIAGLCALISTPLALVGNIWPRLVVAAGLGLSVAWVAAVGYGLFRVVQLAF